MKSTTIALLLVTLGGVAAAQAPADWPRFGGPDRTSSVPHEGLDLDWPEGGPAVEWRASIGPGYGGVSVRDGEVYLLDREVGEKNVLRVFDLESGKEEWTFEYEAKGRLSFPGSRSVPTVEEDHVYISGGFGLVHCLDRETHELVWSTDVEELYDGRMPTFGWSASPLVVDGLVILAPLGEFVGLLALDRFTGEEAWITDGLGYSHSAPTLVELHGEPQILFLSNTQRATGQDQSAPMTVWSFDPEHGDLNWKHTTNLTRLPIPGPIQIDDERLFLTGGYRGGSTMLRVTHEEGKFSFEELFHIDRGAQIHQPLRHGEHLYLLVNENWNDGRARRKEGGLLCLSLDGEEVWRTGDAPFFGRGNAILVGDHLLVQDGFNGVLRAVEATPEGYRQVAEANVFGIEDSRDRQMWAPMALAGGRLLLRSDEELLCLRL
jgi:outer membrane protein assembly factor BamB